MGTSYHILVADDEVSIRYLMQTGLELSGFRVTCVSSGREALNVARTEALDAVISDVFMADGDGLDLARELRALHPHLAIILMTAQGSLDVAVKAVAEGVNDFIAKPFEVAQIAALLRRNLDARREASALAAIDSATLAEQFSKSGLIGRSAAMVKVYKLIAYAARTDATALILGESGTGKELVARAIHDFSRRAGKPFIAVNCSGLTDTLLEAELFGHTKGSFTGAVADRMGLFEAAEGGTLFLDELASTSAVFQASLLRALQTGEVRRIGSTQTWRVNVRTIGSSNIPLQGLVKAGSCRSDLFYRLSVLTIELPSLRERPGDIPLLTAHFLKQTSGQSQPLHLTEAAISALQSYPFPGNVRELQNALTRAVALCSGGPITLDCLPPQIAQEDAASSSRVGMDQLSALAADRPTMEELQRRYLILTLCRTGGNRRRAAELLGLHPRTIHRFAKKYQIIPAGDEGQAGKADAAGGSVDRSHHELPEDD
jgi:two-component system, NtrC family, response regulator PilR